MKIKFLRTIFIAMLCAIGFLVITFVPSIQAINGASFIRGFTIGMGTVALIASIYYCVELQKEKRPGNER